MGASTEVEEWDRLRELHELEVLDTAPDVRFDRITNLAAELIDVPIALITLLDEHRQWFKSCIGLDATETPRELAFCEHAIKTPDVMVVEDAQRDPRFVDHPYVTGEPFIRFYAGAPLITASGARLGTLCVVDTRPRSLDDAQISLLQSLSSLVVDALDGHRLAISAQAEAARATAAEQVSRERERELLRANRALDQFAAAVSHDLRAPLRHVGAHVGMLREAFAFEGEAARLIESVSDSVSHMQRLIDSMLQYARASNRTTNKERTTLGRIVENARNLVGGELGYQNLTFEAGPLPDIECDSELLGRVFENLLRNALKCASDEPLHVHIVGANRGNEIEISVADNGVGIDLKYKDVIFEPFTRLRADLPGPPGAGIGLALCRNVIESHGGRIWLDTTHQRGACFRFTLPVVPEAADGN